MGVQRYLVVEITLFLVGIDAFWEEAVLAVLWRK